MAHTEFWGRPVWVVHESRAYWVMDLEGSRAWRGKTATSRRIPRDATTADREGMIIQVLRSSWRWRVAESALAPNPRAPYADTVTRQGGRRNGVMQIF
jgi:hypothetical protein